MSDGVRPGMALLARDDYMDVRDRTAFGDEALKARGYNFIKDLV